MLWGGIISRLNPAAEDEWVVTDKDCNQSKDDIYQTAHC